MCGCWSARRRPALSQSWQAVSLRCGKKAALGKLTETISASTDAISGTYELQQLARSLAEVEIAREKRLRGRVDSAAGGEEEGSAADDC